MNEETNTPNAIIANAIIADPKLRQLAYRVTAALGLALGATQVGFLTAGANQPLWLTVALGVYGFLATGMGVTAASNTPK